ncbi:uncharacterized protein CDAR_567921 [Caerostris darwini]|uniref:C2H2-type domain-containing protein n=1 Tax=Caerostris darwini TaxID=1538125 RepID=A0AAV4SM35_9ARAC|nr:uncharacterized protein CDAR_567921 [Caerostris darwini]
MSSNKQQIVEDYQINENVVAGVPNDKIIVSNEKSENHKCDVCERLFSKAYNLNRHKKNVHEIDSSSSEIKDKLFKCRKCTASFSTVRNRRRHEIKQHKFVPEKKQNFKCSECNKILSECNKIDHFCQEHPDIVIVTNTHSFTSVEEFNVWKLNEEKQTSACYSLKNSYGIKNKTVKHFACHRSGIFNSKNSGKRHLKLGSSNKIGFYCPPSKHTTFFDNGTVDVSFVSTHIGHSCEVGRLRLTKSEKTEIAGQLHAGIKIPDVLNKIANTVSPTKRLAATEAQDVRNIAKSYGVNMTVVRNENDALSVDSWINFPRRWKVSTLSMEDGQNK